MRWYFIHWSQQEDNLEAERLARQHPYQYRPSLYMMDQSSVEGPSSCFSAEGPYRRWCSSSSVQELATPVRNPGPFHVSVVPHLP